MNTIVSGTTSERLIRTSLIALLVAGYSLWSLWDGYVAYPKANVESAIRDKIGAITPSPLPKTDDSLTAETIKQWVQPGGAAPDGVSPGPPPITHDGKRYYFGHAGYAKVETVGDRIVRVEWHDGPKHSAADLAFQRFMGFALLPVAMVLAVHLVRVIRTRAVLSESGLALRGRSPIPLEAIRTVKSGKPGRYELTYESGAHQKTVILDDYKLKAAPQIVHEICTHRGLTPPSGAR